MPSRRTLLGTVAGAATALAGCTDATEEPNNGDPTARSPTPTATEERTGTDARMGATQRVGESEVTVSEPRVQSSIVHPASADSMDVTTAYGRFVLLGIEATDPAPGREEFALVAAGGEHGPTDTGFGPSVVVDGGRRRGYDERTAEGWLAFEVPPQESPPEPLIECRDAAWRLPAAVGRALAQPSPEWELRSFEVPDELHPGEEFEVRVGVENAGDVDATFRGALNVSNLNYAYIPYPFAVEVAAGERGTWSKTLSVPADIGEGRPVFYLRTPAGSRRREAEVVTGTATPE